MFHSTENLSGELTGCTSLAALRHLVLQSPSNNQKTRDTSPPRSPARPNLIATSIVKFVGIEGNVILVCGLDCLYDPPLLDIQPTAASLRRWHRRSGGF